MLLEHHGEIVTREELQRRVWSADTFVDFDHGLNKAINKLREALDDSAASPRFVETVARRGYRFLADVQVIDASTPYTPALAAAAEQNPNLEPSEAFETPAPLPAPERRRSPRSWIAAVAALALVVAALFAWRLRSTNHPAPVIRSIAVLPMESLSNDASQDYFADGMTDELISDLGQISALRVISRTSAMTYKHARKALPEIARELNVDAVVEGTVFRSGDHVRITVQLIDGATDRHLWSHSYENESRDALALQNTVARAIADQIQIKLNPLEQTALTNVRIVNPDAYEFYLKGRYFWNKRTAVGLETALGYFNQAIDADPKYVQAYSGLADSYALLADWEYGVMTPRDALPRAKAAAIKAVALDSTLGEAHNSLAFCLDVFDWDWSAAEMEFQRAIELNPGYAAAHQWYAAHLIVLGRNNEAIAELRKAESLDPLSLIIRADLAEFLLIAHSYDESIQESRKAIELDPNFALAHNQLGQAYLQKHMNDEAIAELRLAVQLSGNSPTCVANLARAYAASGNRSEATRLLGDLEKGSSAGFSHASEIAIVYVALGNSDRAMQWLEKGYEERFNPSALVRPGFDPLRTDARFKNLLHRIGLPG